MVVHANYSPLFCFLLGLVAFGHATSVTLKQPSIAMKAPIALPPNDMVPIDSSNPSDLGETPDEEPTLLGRTITFDNNVFNNGPDEDGHTSFLRNVNGVTMSSPGSTLRGKRIIRNPTVNIDHGWRAVNSNQVITGDAYHGFNDDDDEEVVMKAKGRRSVSNKNNVYNRYDNGQHIGANPQGKGRKPRGGTPRRERSPGRQKSLHRW
nr:PREDICTED: uncharacterized protein LOC109031243 isoform X1 [Bemisia tabaci]